MSRDKDFFYINCVPSSQGGSTEDLALFDLAILELFYNDDHKLYR